MSNKLIPAVGLAVAVYVASARGAHAQAVQLSGTGTVQFHVVHKFHEVVSKCEGMAVRGAVDDSGLKVMARARVQCFDSGNANRDVNVMEAVDAEKYPWVSVRAALAGFKLPSEQATTKLQVDAAVELHGVSVNHPIELVLTTKDGAHFHVSFEFVEKMTEHDIERPSLFFIEVNDDMDISGSADVEARR